MTNDVKPQKIWVLGDGQLGAMLKHAAMPLNLTVEPIDINATELPNLQPLDRVTAEREQWPDTPVTQALSEHPHFLNKNTFSTLADRATQKSLLDELKISTAPWQKVEVSTIEATLHEQLGPRVLLKRRTGGYDGRGQHWLKQAEASKIPADWHEQAIAEAAIDFDEEVSIIGVRGKNGDCFFYPLTLNLNTDGILMATVSPTERLSHLQAAAETMLKTLLDHLDYVGVLAIELFRLGDTLMVNELAPRVHNTGHWTQAGASISQFEYHVRAVADLPLTAATIKAPSVMVNLIGTEWDERWLGVKGAEVYWYGKSHRPGRKLGHINICSGDKSLLRASLEELRGLLPENYAPCLDWVLKNI